MTNKPIQRWELRYPTYSRRSIIPREKGMTRPGRLPPTGAPIRSKTKRKMCNSHRAKGCDTERPAGFNQLGHCIRSTIKKCANSTSPEGEQILRFSSKLH